MSNAPEAPPPASAEPPEDASRFTVRVSAESHFAWLRTRLGLERTVMASVRTAVSLIGFGFTIVQFFDRMGQMAGSAPPRLPGAPFYLGLGLIFCGVALLMISIWDYRRTVAYLWNKDYVAVAGRDKEPEMSPIIGVAVVLTIVGIFAFFAVLLRLL